MSEQQYTNQSTGYVEVNGSWYTVSFENVNGKARFSLVVDGFTAPSVYVVADTADPSSRIVVGLAQTWVRITGTNYFTSADYGSSTPPAGTNNTPTPGAGTGTTTTGLKKAVVTITVSNDRGERITITAKEGESLPSGITGINATLLVSPYINASGALVPNMRMYKVMLTPAADTYERRVYTATYVNKFGEEGPPSPPLEMDVSPYVQNNIVVPAPLSTVYTQPQYVPATSLNSWVASSTKKYYYAATESSEYELTRYERVNGSITYECYIPKTSSDLIPPRFPVYYKTAGGWNYDYYAARVGGLSVWAPAQTLPSDWLYPGQSATNNTGSATPAATVANAYVDVVGIRLYRTAAGATTDYLYVKEVSGNTRISSSTEIYDNVLPDALGHTLDTYDYYPPDQALQGIGVMANGIMYGIKGNEIHFSEPYLPYAWKPKAIKPLPRNIVAACPFEGGLYAITDAEPYIIQGTSPELMTDMRLPIQQGGLHKKAICNYNGAVVYGSNDGLVQLTGTQASLTAAQQFFTREKWRERLSNGTVFNGAQLRLNVHDGQLLCWFAGGSPGSFMIKLDETAPSLTRIGSPANFIATAVNPIHDKLMFLERDYSGTKTTVSSFADSGTRRSALWMSKEFILPKPTHMAVLQVYGSGTVTCTVYGDGNAVVSNQTLDLSVMTRKQIRLPATRAQRWSVYFQTSNGEVVEAYLANSVLELRNV